jgi:hypothetical protein
MRSRGLVLVRGECQRRGPEGQPCLADLDVVAGTRAPCPVCAPYLLEWSRAVRLMLRAAEVPRPAVRRSTRAWLHALALLYAAAAGLALVEAIRGGEAGWVVAACALVLLCLQAGTSAARV